MTEIGVSTIDSRIADLLQRLEGAAPLTQAVGYALAGGKRIRPLLTLAFCADLGGKPDRIMGAALALEIVHAASLIHDDLPSLDNDDMRRGQPSCHKKFGEATALLAGDYMIALAFQSLHECSLAPQTVLRMSTLFARSFIELCNGQQLDLAPPQERGDLVKLHELKTGALFSTALAFGAWGAECRDDCIEEAQKLGRAVGLAFQIVDDYLDLFGSAAQRGRSDSSDVRNNKPTFFNQADASGGLQLLDETRGKVEVMLHSFMHPAGGPRLEFAHTRAILDDIFNRVVN